jgi:hypothetical protein
MADFSKKKESLDFENLENSRLQICMRDEVVRCVQ